MAIFINTIMAEDKTGIIVYASWIKKFEALTDDEAGRLIKHFFRYVNDENPIPPDRITEIAFIDIEDTLKRDLIKWEKRAERSRLNGSKGGRPPIEEPKKTQQVISEPGKPDNVNVIVNGNVIGNVNDINTNKGDKEKKLSKKAPLKDKIYFIDLVSKSFENTNCKFSTDFKNLWFKLLKEKKWKGKSQTSIDKSLEKLNKYEEAFSYSLVEFAIAGEWQGVVYPDTDKKYKIYLSEKDGQTNINTREGAAESIQQLKRAAFDIIAGNQAG